MFRNETVNSSLSNVVKVLCFPFNALVYIAAGIKNYVTNNKNECIEFLGVGIFFGALLGAFLFVLQLIFGIGDEDRDDQHSRIVQFVQSEQFTLPHVANITVEFRKYEGQTCLDKNTRAIDYSTRYIYDVRELTAAHPEASEYEDHCYVLTKVGAAPEKKLLSPWTLMKVSEKAFSIGFRTVALNRFLETSDIEKGWPKTSAEYKIYSGFLAGSENINVDNNDLDKYEDSVLITCIDFISENTCGLHVYDDKIPAGVFTNTNMNALIKDGIYHDFSK